MNVFVLCSGRCGSKTFALACKPISNFTCGHETRANLFGDKRFIYPDQHIEVDNRLSWLLGSLHKSCKDKNVFYVHLKRNHQEVANSFLKRLSSHNNSSIINAFANGILMQNKSFIAQEKKEISDFFVKTVNENIEEFLIGKNHMIVNLQDNGETFKKFLQNINAVGDIEKSLKIWNSVHNASK